MAVQSTNDLAPALVTLADEIHALFVHLDALTTTASNLSAQLDGLRGALAEYTRVAQSNIDIYQSILDASDGRLASFIQELRASVGG